MHNSVIDTEVRATNFVDFLREFKVIFKKTLTRRGAGPRMSCLMKKKPEVENLVRVPLRIN
jgi:hypothetical protein